MSMIVVGIVLLVLTFVIPWLISETICPHQPPQFILIPVALFVGSIICLLIGVVRLVF